MMQPTVDVDSREVRVHQIRLAAAKLIDVIRSLGAASALGEAQLLVELAREKATEYVRRD
jgi:hypothetical protein